MRLPVWQELSAFARKSKQMNLWGITSNTLPISYFCPTSNHTSSQMEKKNTESHFRSILKAVSWRAIATTTTFLLALLVFREDPNALEKSTQVAALELILKLALYYFHERAWQMLPRGTLRKVIRKN